MNLVARRERPLGKATLRFRPDEALEHVLEKRLAVCGVLFIALVSQRLVGSAAWAATAAMATPVVRARVSN